MNHATIVGGGIAGLSTAIALHQSGVQVEILEACSQSDFHNVTAGASAQLTPNGLRALQLLGGNSLLNRVLEISSVVENNYMVMPSKEQAFDNVMALLSSPPNALPTVMIRWGLLRQFLAEQLPEAAIKFDQKITSYNGQHLELDNGTHKTIPGLLIAADGKASRFRPTSLVSNNRVNIKAVVAQVAPLPNASNSTYSIFSPTGLACFLGPTGQGWTYWAISVPVADEAEEQAFFQMDLPSVQTRLLQHIERGLATAAERQVYVDLIRQTPADTIVVQGSSQADLPETFVSNNLVLVGDAAHAMNASYGQCIAFALEDAVTLGHCLRQQNNLAAYNQMRRSRCLQMQQKSQERTAKAMRGENTDEITNWIHNWDLATPYKETKNTQGENRNDTPVLVVG